MANKDKICILVLGMHRSGTSALAGALNMVGIDFGASIVPPSFDNPRGFFENSKVQELNNEILTALNIEWHFPVFLEDNWQEQPAVRVFKKRALDILDSEFGKASVFAIKDPRICYLFPFWEKIIQEFGASLKCIIPLRNPMEVVQSLKKRNNFSTNKSHLLTTTHLLNAEKHSKDYPRIFISYDQLIEDPNRCVSAIVDGLKLESSVNDLKDINFSQFISKSLKHNSSEKTSFQDANLLPYLKNNYTLLEKLKGQTTISTQQEVAFEQFRQEHKELTATFYDGVLGRTALFSKIFIDTGKGYNEGETILQEVTSGLHSWDIQELSKYDHVKGIKILPVNTPCVIGVKYLGLGLLEESAYEISSNSYFTEKNTYYFDTDYSEIIISFKEPTTIEKLVLTLEYLSLGQEVSDAIKDLDYGRIIASKEGEIKSNLTVIKERDLHLGVKEKEIEGLKKVIQEYQVSIQEYQASLKRESEERINIVSILQDALEAEKIDKNHIKQSLQKALETEKEEHFRAIREARDAMFNELKDKEYKINTLRDTIVHEIGERNKVVTDLVSSVNHEVRERENTVANLLKSIDHEKREQERIERDLRSSFSFKLGWLLTAPARIVYNIFSLPKKGKTGLALEIAKTAVRNPIQTVKSINRENIRTLQTALTRESPELIANNFNRLVSDDSALLQAEEEAKRLQKELIGLGKVAATAGVMATTAVAVNGATNGHDPTININGSANGISKAQFSNNFESVTRKNTKQTILYISPNLPDYDTSSGGKRATRMLGLLAEECKVYAYARGGRQQKYIDKLNSLGVEVIQHYDYDAIKADIPHIDVIIYAWYYTSHESARFMELYPNAKIILDSVDIHWVRESRSIGLWEGLTEEIVAKNKESEVAAYKKADVVWTVTEPDRQAVLKEIPDADVRVVSNIHDTAFTEYYPTKKNNILFFGGYNHYPNLSAAKILANDIIPKVREQIPDATLLIAGANAPEEIIALGELPGVNFLGFIEEEDVDNLYKSSMVCVAPLLAGAGIKGKICESIAYMTPVITNTIGNEGIALVDGVDGFITEDIDEMVARTVEVMKGKHDLELMTSKAQDKLHAIVGPQTVKKRMLDSNTREVSICIVTWNRLELLKPCIDSILANTNYPYYKVLVHSNGCEDGTQAYLKEIAEKDDRIIPILSDKNDVFVIPNNQMAEMFPHNDVVLLNNDVTVEPNWLQALNDAAYSSRKIAIVGSKLLYPDGTLQEFGSELYANGSGRNIGKWDKEPFKKEYSQVTAVGYVSGCSLYAKRETIKKIGLFDMQFHPCYCEDSDLCYTAWENDMYVLVTPYSIINHFEGGTSGTDEDSGFKSYQKVNFEKFLAKHKTHLPAIETKIKSLNKMLLS